MSLPPTAINPAPVRKPLRILYADDMLELRELAKALLTKDGHSLECVPDGTAALECIRTDPAAFDVLITDHHMPELNGLELVTCVRDLPFAGKILVLSSELSPAVHSAYLNLNVAQVLHKPVLAARLRQVLADIQG